MFGKRFPLLRFSFVHNILRSSHSKLSYSVCINRGINSLSSKRESSGRIIEFVDFWINFKALSSNFFYSLQAIILCCAKNLAGTTLAVGVLSNTQCIIFCSIFFNKPATRSFLIKGVTFSGMFDYLNGIPKPEQESPTIFFNGNWSQERYRYKGRGAMVFLTDVSPARAAEIFKGNETEDRSHNEEE